jgi:hypothetical protein
MKAVLGIIATIIAIIGYIPYIKDTFKGKTKPHIFSWFLWSLVSFIAFGIQITNKGAFGSLPNLVMGIICLVILSRALLNGTKDISKIDIFSLILALLAIVLWLVAKQDLLSIFLIILVDMFSFLPTFRKSWNKPKEETLITWIMSCIRQVLIILALGEINLVNVAFPAYALVINIIFCFLLVYRRKRLI